MTSNMWSNDGINSGQSLSTSDHELSFVSHSINSDSFNGFSPYSYHETFSSHDETSQRTGSSNFSIRHNTDSSKQEDSNINIEHDLVLQSGFSFGKRSTSFEPTPDCPDQDDDDSYKMMEDIYGTEMTELTTFKNMTPAAAEHRVISKRIGKVGYIGQNLALGHIIESFTEDPGLRPKLVQLEVTEYVIDEDSPVQIDVKWSKPENADRFKSLTYNIVMKPLFSHDDWMPVSSVKFPVFRIYHTDDKLLLGKVHVSRQSYDLTYALRCQTQGEIHHDGVSHMLYGDWSKDITLTFCGYQTDPKTDISFSL